MSLDMAASSSSERVCYVQCNFCNTVLAVSVPCSSLYTNVAVRCGHCANLLSVNMAGSASSLQTSPQNVQNSQKQFMGADTSNKDCASSSRCEKLASFGSIEQEQPRMPPIRPPEKRQRVPSAYNKFIKEEIQRIKANNPEISHKEAFSTAAKNWAHFPHINWLKMDGNKRAKSDQSFTEGSQKSNGFY